MEIICGIYGIHRETSKKWYIGSSNNIEQRFRQHKYNLNNNSHHNIKLQKDWNKYNHNLFDFCILKECKSDELQKYENEYIEKYNAIKDGYNIKEKSGQMKPKSEETRYYLYRLKDTNTNEIIYIGKSLNIDNRIYAHNEIEFEIYKEQSYTIYCEDKEVKLFQNILKK